MIRISVSGLSELKARFDAISGDKQDELMTQCFERGARTIQGSVQSFAASKSGRTKSAVVIKTTKSKKGQITTRIQLDKGFYKGDAFYAAFQEFGWHAGKRSNPNRKFVQGKHFFRQAMQAHTSDVPQRICQDLANGIERLDQ